MRGVGLLERVPVALAVGDRAGAHGARRHRQAHLDRAGALQTRLEFRKEMVRFENLCRGEASLVDTLRVVLGDLSIFLSF